MGSWNDFFGPLLYLKPARTLDPATGVAAIPRDSARRELEQIWALTTMITLPILLVYFFIQEQFVKAFANVSLSK